MKYIVEVVVDGQGVKRVWSGDSLTEGRRACRSAAKYCTGGLDCPHMGPNTEGIEIMMSTAPGNYPGYAVLIGILT